MASPLKVKLPEEATVVDMAVDVPSKLTVAPLPADAGLIDPEMLQDEGTGLPVKVIPLILAPFTVTDRRAGVKE